MKRFKFLFLISFSLFLISCSSDFDAEMPIQTEEYSIHKHGNKIEFDKKNPANLKHESKKHE